MYPKNGKDITAWERITEKDEVERILVEWQRLHFMQWILLTSITPTRTSKRGICTPQARPSNPNRCY